MGRLEGKSVIITGAGGASTVRHRCCSPRRAQADRGRLQRAVKPSSRCARPAAPRSYHGRCRCGKRGYRLHRQDGFCYGRQRSDPMPASAADWCRWPNRPWNIGEVLRVNLIEPFLAIKYSIPHMINRNPARSSAPRRGGPEGQRRRHHRASKAGVINLVQTTAYSLSGTGVRINAVCPGLIENRHDLAVFDNARSAAPTKRSASSTRSSAPASRMSWRRWDCSSPAMMHPMSTARRSRSTAASPPRCRIRENRFSSTRLCLNKCRPGERRDDKNYSRGVTSPELCLNASLEVRLFALQADRVTPSPARSIRLPGHGQSACSRHSRPARTRMPRLRGHRTNPCRRHP